MNIAVISLLAIAAAIFIGYVRGVNTGVAAIALAFLVGSFLGGMSSGEVVEGWPLNLFFILLGITFLFSLANVNGTLVIIARKATFLMGGHRRLIPIAFFVLSAFLAAIGHVDLIKQERLDTVYTVGKRG